MINLDSITNENNKEHNDPDHPYRILIIGGSESGKKNALLNLINEQSDIDKIYLYAKYLSQPMYECLIKNRKNAGIKHLHDVYENIYENNSNRKRKILILFDDMIADIMSNKNFNQ